MLSVDADGPRGDLGVALSGGGVRASAFALGALLYLVDSGLNRRVAVISSVSGASLTNGFLLSRGGSFAKLDVTTFDASASELIRRLTKIPVMGIPTLAVYLVLTVLGALCLSIAACGWPVEPLLPVRLALLATWGILWLRRGRPIEWAIERRYLTPQAAIGRATIAFALVVACVGSASFFYAWYARHWSIAAASPPWMLMAALATAMGLLLKAGARLVRRIGGPGARLFLGSNRRADSTSHVFCTTDLVTQSPLFLVDYGGRGWAYGRYGWFEASRVPLAAAVRASAALPGAFPPRALATSMLIRASTRIRGLTAPSRFHLSDGGVWDNLGTQWFGNAGPAPSEWTTVAEKFSDAPAASPAGARDTRLLLVVDGRAWGTGFTKASAARRALALKIPVVAEWLTLSAVSGIQYENTVEPRTESYAQLLRLLLRGGDRRHHVPTLATLTGQFESAAAEIERAIADKSPHEKALQRLHDSMKAVSNDVLTTPQPEWLSGGRQDQRTLGDLYLRCADVGTKLTRLSRADAMALVIHGYVQAMGATATMMALEGGDATDLSMRFPGIDRFKRLVSGL